MYDITVQISLWKVKYASNKFQQPLQTRIEITPISNSRQNRSQSDLSSFNKCQFFLKLFVYLLYLHKPNPGFLQRSPTTHICQ